VRPGAILSSLNDVQQAQRGALMPWAPVALGLGVALYFSLPAEPGALGYGLAGLVLALGLGLVCLDFALLQPQFPTGLRP